MARTRAPLLSWSASGQIASTQVYAEWKGRPYVRQYVIPSNPNSVAQQLTRNTFKFLNNLWKYLPAGAVEAWALYAVNKRYTSRNGWLSANTGAMREDNDLSHILLSISANNGLIAEDIEVTPGDGTLSVELTPPPLPTGWAIVEAQVMAVLDVDPQTSVTYEIKFGSDAVATPYTVLLEGLTNDVEYVVGGWFKFLRSDGKNAYGQALQVAATPTAA